MAIYHMSAQIIGRSAGRSATAAAAYRAGEKIVDERTGEVHDYSRKKDVDYQEILTPDGAGDWAHDRATLWNYAEQSENRINSQIAREINIAIPKELDPEKGRELVRDYAQRNFVNQGMIADICIHHEGKENPHAHIMLSMREAGPEGFTKKNRDWNDKAQLETWREDWAHSCNKMLEREGLNISIDHRTLEAQGIQREPTKHLGPSATEIERRGAVSELGEYNRSIITQQEELAQAQKELRDIALMIQYLERQPEEIESPKAEPKPEPKTSGREYNEQTTKKAIEYIQSEPDLQKVRQLYFLIRDDATHKDLKTEIQKQAEYRTAEQRAVSAKNEHDSAIYQQKRIVAEIEKLGMIERTKYKLGKHDLCQREKEAQERTEKAQTEYARAQRDFSETESQLLSPASDVYRQVHNHNQKSHEAQKTYKAVTAHYNERTAKEIERQRKEREQSKGKGIER